MPDATYHYLVTVHLRHDDGETPPSEPNIRPKFYFGDTFRFTAIEITPVDASEFVLIDPLAHPDPH